MEREGPRRLSDPEPGLRFTHYTYVGMGTTCSTGAQNLPAGFTPLPRFKEILTTTHYVLKEDLHHQSCVNILTESHSP